MTSGSRSLDVYGTPEVRKSVANWIVAELENCLPPTMKDPSPRVKERLDDLGSHIEKLAGDCECNQTLADYFRQIEVHLKTIREAGIVEKMVSKEGTGKNKKPVDEAGQLNTERPQQPSTSSRQDDEGRSYIPVLSSIAPRGKVKEDDPAYN